MQTGRLFSPVRSRTHLRSAAYSTHQHLRGSSHADDGAAFQQGDLVSAPRGCCNWPVASTMVMSLFSVSSSSSSLRADAGSSARVGSSSSRTSAPIASARAMHNCCCSPRLSDEAGQSRPSSAQARGRYGSARRPAALRAPRRVVRACRPRAKAKVPRTDMGSVVGVGNTIPIRRRTSRAGKAASSRSMPPNRTWPVTRRSGCISCRRLIARNSVDLPLPESPTTAVMQCRGMSSVSGPSTTWFPKATERSTQSESAGRIRINGERSQASHGMIRQRGERHRRRHSFGGLRQIEAERQPVHPVSAFVVKLLRKLPHEKDPIAADFRLLDRTGLDRDCSPERSNATP